MLRTDLSDVTPEIARAAIRTDDFTGPTTGIAKGYLQANLVILPKSDAYDFLLFCVRNPKPCPLLDVTDAGSPQPLQAAPAADLRFDLPRYRVYERGQVVAEPTSIAEWWREDLVAFLLGCSFSFERELERRGIPMRHWQAGTNVAMYRTNRRCLPAGRFHGPLVVSMRPIPESRVAETVEVTSGFPQAHGAPVQVGSPPELDIEDLDRPDWGDLPRSEPGDVPVFWACGVTPQAMIQESKPGFVITHAPGHMFITDLKI
ncbi:MAG TPA: putative hydro-lyase [Thermomicrobiaceae bacterium]|nr:putative hydro-lyase [Thermomicrobiaceae bacterium]